MAKKKTHSHEEKRRLLVSALNDMNKEISMLQNIKIKLKKELKKIIKDLSDTKEEGIESRLRISELTSEGRSLEITRQIIRDRLDEVESRINKIKEISKDLRSI